MAIRKPEKSELNSKIESLEFPSCKTQVAAQRRNPYFLPHGNRKLALFFPDFTLLSQLFCGVSHMSNCIQSKGSGTPAFSRFTACNRSFVWRSRDGETFCFFLYYGNLVSEFYVNQWVRRPLAPPLDHSLLDALAALPSPSVATACRQHRPPLTSRLGVSPRHWCRSQTTTTDSKCSCGPESWDHV